MADRDIGQGHNGGPPLEEPPLTPKLKLAHIQGILERRDLSPAQKCIGIGIVTAAEKDGVAKLDTPMLQTFASAKDRETVFRATRKLEQTNTIKKESSRGQRGEYRVLPQSVIQSVIEAYEELKSSRVKPDGITGGTTGGTSGPVSPEDIPELVGSKPTTPPKSIKNARVRVEETNLINTNTYTIDSEIGERGLGGKPLADGSDHEEASEVDALTSLEAFNSYNELAQRLGLPTARTLTPQRRKGIIRRLKEHGPEAWGIALANIERSAFLRGQNNRNWRADLDFVLQPKSFTRLVEGGYGNGAHADDHPSETEEQRWARIADEVERREGTR